VQVWICGADCNDECHDQEVGSQVATKSIVGDEMHASRFHGRRLLLLLTLGDCSRFQFAHDDGQ